MIYTAQSKVDMAKVSNTLDSVDVQRSKWAQQLSNKASLHTLSTLSPYYPLHVEMLRFTWATHDF